MMKNGKEQREGHRIKQAQRITVMVKIVWYMR